MRPFVVSKRPSYKYFSFKLEELYILLLYEKSLDVYKFRIKPLNVSRYSEFVLVCLQICIS